MQHQFFRELYFFINMDMQLIGNQGMMVVGVVSFFLVSCFDEKRNI